MTIQQEKNDDFEEVYALIVDAFRRVDEAVLVENLRKSKAFIPELSLVVKLNNEIIGHILFTKLLIINHHNQNFDSLALAPLAVKPEFQHQGVGSKLIEAGLSKAKALVYQSVIVLGHSNYYTRFGFLPAQNWQITAPFETKNENFMALELIKDRLKNVSGVVKYAPEFGI